MLLAAAKWQLSLYPSPELGPKESENNAIHPPTDWATEMSRVVNDAVSEKLAQFFQPPGAVAGFYTNLTAGPGTRAEKFLSPLRAPTPILGC